MGHVVISFSFEAALVTFAPPMMIESHHWGLSIPLSLFNGFFEIVEK
jgi:hypothetical protein